MKNIDIFSLVSVISYRKVLSYGKFQDTKTKGDNKYFKLFKAIKKGKVANDEEAQEYLKIQNRESFLRFKGRFVRKLLWFVDDSNNEKIKSSIRKPELINLYKNAEILRFMGEKKNSLVLYHMAYNLALKTGFVDIILDVCIALRSIYAYIYIDSKKYLFYNEQVKKYTKSHAEWLELTNLHDEICYLIYNNHSKERTQKRVQEATNVMENFRHIGDLHIFKIVYYEFLIFLYNYGCKFENAEHIINEAVHYVENKKPILKANLYKIYKEVVSLSLAQKNFERALTFLYKSKHMMTRETHSQLKVLNQEFEIYGYMQSYNLMLKLVSEINKNKLINQYPQIFQSWKIKEAFCNLLIMAGKIDSETAEKYPIKSLRINKFINDTEHYSRDKRGQNIAIILVPLIYYLIKKQYGKIQDKVDSLKQYSFKYLRKDSTLRSNCFIKMILKIPDANYHPERTKRYVSKYEKVLKENPAKIGISVLETEIIPYEALWNIVIEIIEKNKIKWGVV